MLTHDRLGADFVDIEHCYVYTYDPKDGSHTKFQLPEHCSTICLTEDPDKLVTTLIKCDHIHTSH